MRNLFLCDLVVFVGRINLSVPHAYLILNLIKKLFNQTSNLIVSTVEM